MAYRPNDEPGTARLICISLEAPNHYSAHRHIRATIVRRAKSDLLRADGTVQVYNDGRAASGYRNAYWSSDKNRAVWVNNLLIRGQIDIGMGALNDGKPYGNDITYDVHYPKAREIEHMGNAVKVLKAKREKIEAEGLVDRSGYDDFAAQVRILALSLGITRCIVPKSKHTARDLSSELNYIEFNLHNLDDHVQHVMDML